MKAFIPKVKAMSSVKTSRNRWAGDTSLVAAGWVRIPLVIRLQVQDYIPTRIHTKILG